MILIRQALPDDKDTILKILDQSEFSNAYMASNRNIYMVVEFEGCIVGTGTMELYEDKALLKHVYILPNYRGHGLGDGLLRAMINFADRRGTEKIYLLNRERTESFKNLGFKDIVDFEAVDILKQFDILQENPQGIIMELIIEDFFNNRSCP